MSILLALVFSVALAYGQQPSVVAGHTTPVRIVAQPVQQQAQVAAQQPAATPVSARQADKHYWAFKPYKGMVEKGGYNRGPFIDSCNRRYAYLKAPYCASCLSELLRRIGVKVPDIKSARARDFITDKSISALKVWKGQDTIPVPCIMVFTRKGGGHVCWVWKVVGDTIYCRDFNSTPDGMGGSFYDGTWSGEKKRSIKKHCAPLNPNRATHFTAVEF